MISSVVIVGGGTAGWLSAAILAAGIRQYTARKIKITLVESPDVSTIGVGEGTWPTMRSTLKRIGISEKEFLQRCSASFKQGSKFIGWCIGGKSDSYHHPFTMPVVADTEALLTAWWSEYPAESFANIATLQPRLIDEGCAPKQLGTPEYAGQFNYGYHLDAGKFAELLKEHCVKNLQVAHVIDHVTAVDAEPDGNIAAIITSKERRIEGDLFLDCSGQAALLIEGHFGVPRLSQSKYSVNDAALAIQLPYQDPSDPISSATLATAQRNGWIWDIGLQNRRGIGYVYSTSHAGRDEALIELQAYIAQSHPSITVDELQPRQIKFSCGYRKEFWIKNCVAVGMSAGFIEPLEASALVMVELAANTIRDEILVPKDLMPIVAKRFNSAFTYRWERIIDFLKLHYILSKRQDTQYWRDATSLAAVPDCVQDLLSLWGYRAPSLRDFNRVDEIFPAASYQYVLYGMMPEMARRSLLDATYVGIVGKKLTHERNSYSKYRNGLPSNRALLSHLEKFDFVKS